MNTRPCITLLTLFLVACGPPQEPDTPGEGRSSERWTLVEDLRLGTLDEGGPEQFTQIAWITTDQDDNLYVLDYPSQEIRVFDGEGRYTHTIGGQGEGPGELLRAAGLNWGPEGRLWAWDPGNNRFSAFEKDGTFVTSHRRMSLGVIYPWRGEFTPDGRYTDWGLDRPGSDPRSGMIGTLNVFYPIRLSADFTTQDTLPSLEYEFEMSSDGSRPLPFGRGLSTYQDRSGSIWFANTKDYTIYERTLEGDTLQSFSIDFEPAPVTAQELDSIASQQMEMPEQFRVPIDEIPPTKPVVRRIFSDNAEYLYVVPETAEHDVGTVVDVFTLDGDHVTRAEFPQRISHPLPPPHATPTHLYVIVKDEFDVEYVSRLRIVREGGDTAVVDDDG